MSQESQIALIVIGLIVIAVLSYIIYRQLQTQKQLKLAQEQALAEAQQKAQEQRDYLLESVRVISMAMRDEQCELAEGCIRLKVLLDHLAPFLHEHQDFCIINTMYESTKHMPILDEWKKLKLRRRMELTREREALENEHREAILAAVGKLYKYNFEH